ncbi:hypothetical protein SBADM41S_02136 [Streptomyces badius]
MGAQTSDRRYRKKHGTAKADFTRGVAITSSIHPDDNTHIEPVRYGRGSNAMGALTVLQVPYGAHRVRGWIANMIKHPTLAARSLSNRRWSERTIIGLVMQSLDNSLTTYRKPGGVGRACSPPARATAPPTRRRSRRRPSAPPCSPRRSTASPDPTSAS